MSKRKKASSSASRRARDGHISTPKRASGPHGGRVGAAGAKSVRKRRPHPGDRLPAHPGALASIPPSTTLSLPAECTVSGATALKEQLAGLLDEALPVTLDIASLQRVDTAAMQVITAFVRERTVKGLPVEWQGSAPVFVTAAQLLGLTSLLKLPA